MIDDVYLLERIHNFRLLVRKYFDRNSDDGFANESLFILKNLES